MKSLIVFLVFFLSALVGADNIDTLLNQRTKFVQNRFIVEVDHSLSLNRRGEVLHPLDAVYHEFESRAIRTQVTKEFKMEGIFNGATLIVNNAEDYSRIRNTPGVKGVRPIKFYSAQRPTKHIVPKSVEDASIPPDTLSTHILGGVDKVHAEGNIGKGVKIGIIDTGIDYNHPFLGSNGFGPGKKIVTGYDFAGNDFNFDNSTAEPKPDPMDCNGHGTHVAGIIAAEPGNPYNITGVAYGATLGAYKIFGCTGDTSDDLVVEALLQGVKDGMDILTLSLGTADGWADGSAAVVADRIAKSGKIVTIAAGNDGPSGSWYTYEPASAENVISVGSVDNSVIPLQNATVQGVGHPPITYYSGVPLNINGSLPIYATSTNTSVEDDACSPLAPDTPNLSKYLVVMRRGTCEVVTKLANAAAKGAKAMLIYDNGNGFVQLETENYTASFIQAADGEFLIQQFAANATITISFPQVGGATNFPVDTGGLMSSFSSYGPTFDFKFKPAVSAPGNNILSTYPIALGSYAVDSGTSMATPFVAGGAALLLAAKGNSSSIVQGARNLFESTSTMIFASKNDFAFDTLSKAGAGLINVYNAIHAATLVSPGELILNDTAHFQGTQIIDVQNVGNITKEYTLKHVPALTALTMRENTILPSLGPVPLVSNPATVGISPDTFYVSPGASQKVVVTFRPPTGLDTSRYPLYSGFVEVTSGLETYHVSYIGLAASLRDHQLFDNSTFVVPISSPSLISTNLKTNISTQPTEFTFNSTDNPSFFCRLAMGTPSLLIDLVDSNIQFTPTFQRRAPIVSDQTLSVPNPNSTFADMNIIGRMYSQAYVNRNDETVNSTIYSIIDFTKPQFANGTKIPNGQYRMLVRALRITGNPTSEGDYESWLSPIINISA